MPVWVPLNWSIICDIAYLVENDAELRLGGGEVEHGFAKVFAILGIEPCGANDDVIAPDGGYALLAMQLGEAVDTGGCALLRLATWGVVGVAAENVVGGDVNQ